ncbi:MAG: hypothetical protein AOA65_1431 [Candidatus Bathyarchaeota archaeon BA1]|nr:MAG: hypothetical protein AOA65_1431 [Candidatus Bathyarchaeota archaeon BA1]
MKDQLTFSDSFYAAAALALELTLVSSDATFKYIPRLKYMPINEYVSSILGESV